MDCYFVTDTWVYDQTYFKAKDRKSACGDKPADRCVRTKAHNSLPVGNLMPCSYGDVTIGRVHMQ